jgi:hypothetical protein
MNADLQTQWPREKDPTCPRDSQEVPPAFAILLIHHKQEIVKQPTISDQ